MFLVTEKCRIYEGCDVSQTFNIETLIGNCENQNATDVGDY